MKHVTYQVKSINATPLPWAVYRVARDAPDVRTLVALVLTEDIARRIAALLEAEP